METKKFHIGDVLSITTGRLVSPRHIDGVYDILNFMTSDNLFTHQLPRAMRECQPHLLKQFPQFDSPNNEAMIAELEEMLGGERDRAKSDAILARWLAIQVGKFGETFDVAKVPPHAHEQIDPESELAEFVHPDKIIKVEV